MGNSLLLKNAFGECIRLVSLARSCAANAVCINYFMQVHFSPLVHMISITQDKHKTSKLEALLMGREQN